VKTVPLSDMIATKAGQLRKYYRNINDGRPPLCRDDAYHLATAIVYDVDVMHTFDASDKKNCRGLVDLNGNVAGYPLKITKPKTAQGSLEL
jgi:hypothetical protein